MKSKVLGYVKVDKTKVGFVILNNKTILFSI